MHTSFLNCRLCINGQLTEGKRLIVSEDNGLILQETGFIGGDAVDLDDGIIAPGFLELQTNGVNGFHFSMFDEGAQWYEEKLAETARWYVQRGVTGFWATVPTVERGLYGKILPHLRPRAYPNSASLLGAHVEGPYLAPSKKGAHNSSLFLSPADLSDPNQLYGQDYASSVKLVTLAPELPNAASLIKIFASQGIRVSLGHSAASFDQGLEALKAGATSLTHTLNAMNPLISRNPGLAGLITLPESEAPYYTTLGDGHHIHPRVATLLHRAAPQRSILISDSIELTGLPDGTYPGHAQIPHPQVKTGGIAKIAGTDILIGACSSVDECVRNLIKWSGCSVAEAVRCVTENVAALMGVESERGVLREGARADFVVLDDGGHVLETWVAGRKVWEK